MEARVGGVVVHYAEHGAGQPVLVLHGAGVDHREAEGTYSMARLRTTTRDRLTGSRAPVPAASENGRTVQPGRRR